MRKQYMLERECVHRDEGADGDSYNGIFFVQALQRMSSDEALKIAGRVTPFYWADAARVVVWLCEACATDLRLNDTPRVVVQAARR